MSIYTGFCAHLQLTNGGPSPSINEIKSSPQYGIGKNFCVLFYLVNDESLKHTTEAFHLLFSCQRYYYPE